MCKVIQFNPLQAIDYFIEVHERGDQDPEWNWYYVIIKYVQKFRNKNVQMVSS